MLKKMFIITVALLACTGLFAQEGKQKIRLAPGTACYAWNENTFVKPKSVPVGGFVDMAAGFRGGNIRVCEELRNLKAHNFVMWEGFLRVPKDDTFRFTLIHTSANHLVNIKIFLDSSDLITRREKDPQTMTATASLKQGFCKVRIYMNNCGWNSFDDVSFQLKYAPGTAMKMTDITPATLYHQSEDEE